MELMTEYEADYGYEYWLEKHIYHVWQYAKLNDEAIRDLPITAHAFNALRMSGIEKMSQLVKLTPRLIKTLPLLKQEDIGEILLQRECYLVKQRKEIIAYVLQAEQNATPNEEITDGQPKDTENVGEYDEPYESDHVAQEIVRPEKQEKILQFFEDRKVPIELLNLSVRSYNALKRAGINYIHEALKRYPDGFWNICNIGKKSVDEICRALEVAMQNACYQMEGDSDFDAEEKIDSENNAPWKDIDQEEEDAADMSLLELLHHPLYREKTIEFLKANDIPLIEGDLSVRSYNALMREGYKSLLELLYAYPKNLYSVRNLGTKSILEIRAWVDAHLKKLQPLAYAYCQDDIETMYSDSYITERLLARFDGVGFEGLSFQQMKEALPERIDERRIKKCIGALLAAHELEYVDFRCYRVYPSIFDVLKDSEMDDRCKEILLQRFSGRTLEEIGNDQGLTRERVRQIIKKAIKEVQKVRATRGLRVFDEDFYQYLYMNYEIDKELWSGYLCIPQRTLHYLSNAYAGGKKPIEDAMEDPNVNVSLKFRIRDYLNRNRIMIDGTLVEKRRETIENYAVAKFCKEEMRYDDFIDCYNSLLRNNNISFNDRLYYTDEIRRTRINRLSESMCCLWKQGERLRYYNIPERDYSELLGTLNLEEYQNTELSTLKLMNEYPDLMEKYDIRDQYELHNLLKKIVDPTICRDIVFSRQPILRFGKFDRDQAIYEMIEELSPVTADDLTKQLELEYGYDQSTALANYVVPFMKYYQNGVFSVDFKRIPESHMPLLQDKLPDDFYFISEIKEIYQKIFPNADLDEINPRSLKTMGYTVLGKYVLRRHKTAESFFREILLRDDVFSITAMRKRFGTIQMYYQTLLSLKRNLDILLFDKDQYLNIRRLERLGVTKADLLDYCDRVYAEVAENTMFTVYSLKNSDDAKISDLGFDELFYAELLAVSGKFLYTQCFGKTVFYKGSLPNGISKNYFIQETLGAYESVELDDYIADCYEKYGIRIDDKYEILEAISGTNFYYDNIMNKIYRDKNDYYAEFDE